MTTKNTFNVDNNPTGEVDLVLDMTLEEEFYSKENPTEEDKDLFIVHLERKLKSVKDAVKVLHDEAEAMPSATFFKNKLWKIFKQ